MKIVSLQFNSSRIENYGKSRKIVRNDFIDHKNCYSISEGIENCPQARREIFHFRVTMLLAAA
jgi:hypothetical protein